MMIYLYIYDDLFIYIYIYDDLFIYIYDDLNRFSSVLLPV
jgi:hypothetical protein